MMHGQRNIKLAITSTQLFREQYQVQIPHAGSDKYVSFSVGIPIPVAVILAVFITLYHRRRHGINNFNYRLSRR
jgi:hypothetical protein